MKLSNLFILSIVLLLSSCYHSNEITGDPEKDAKSMTEKLSDLITSIDSENERIPFGDSIVVAYGEYYLHQPIEKCKAFYDEWHRIMGENNYYHNIWNDVVSDEGPAVKLWNLYGVLTWSDDREKEISAYFESKSQENAKNEEIDLSEDYQE